MTLKEKIEADRQMKKEKKAAAPIQMQIDILKAGSNLKSIKKRKEAEIVEPSAKPFVTPIPEPFVIPISKPISKPIVKPISKPISELIPAPEISEYYTSLMPNVKPKPPVVNKNTAPAEMDPEPVIPKAVAPKSFPTHIVFPDIAEYYKELALTAPVGKPAVVVDPKPKKVIAP